MTETNHKRSLSIWQQNVNKSPTCQHDLISSGKLIEEQISLIALQEPSINQFGKTIASRDWVATVGQKTVPMFGCFAKIEVE